MDDEVVLLLTLLQGGSRHHECALCMDIFTSPRLLPCFHTFCLKCLQQLVQINRYNQQFPCPTCRTDIPIPEGGVEKFQVNFYIEAELENKHGTCDRICDICQKNTVTHKCTDCDQFACDTCTSIHASFASTRSHTVLKLKELALGQYSGQDAAKITKYRYCTAHSGEKIRFFCKQCSSTICRDCKLTSHEGHATVDLSVMSSKAKQIITKATELSRKGLEPKLVEQMDAAAKHTKNVQDKKRELKALLERRAKELKKEIDEKLTQAKQQLDQVSSSVESTVEGCVYSMEMELASFLSLIEHAERVAKVGCEADVIEMPKQLQQFFGEGQTYQRTMEKYRQLHQCSRKRRACLQSSDVGTPINQIHQHFAATPQMSDINKSSCKLKSFTDCQWKADVKMDEGKIQCTNCRKQYDSNCSVCPNCSYKLGGIIYSSIPTRTKQCKNCRNTLAQNCQQCPRCGVSLSENKQAAVMESISNYIGKVVRSEFKEEKNTNQQVVFGAQGRVSKPPNPSLSDQISDEINAVQSCLSEWSCL